jgi:UDP-N-acetyl-D-mannosaminuronate dehydrogenase
MFPGLGVGGYCLTKDPLFAKISTKQILKKRSTNFPLCSSAVDINHNMPSTSMKFIELNYKKKLSKKRVLFFGITYKNEIGDLRHSPSLDLIKKFIDKKSKCYYFDPFVKEINMKQLNKIQLFSHLKNFDLIIICVNHLKFKTIKFAKLLSNSKTFLFDLNNVLTINQINKIKKNNINFYSFGREITKYRVI